MPGSAISVGRRSRWAGFSAGSCGPSFWTTGQAWAPLRRTMARAPGPGALDRATIVSWGCGSISDRGRGRGRPSLLLDPARVEGGHAAIAFGPRGLDHGLPHEVVVAQ